MLHGARLNVKSRQSPRGSKSVSTIRDYSILCVSAWFCFNNVSGCLRWHHAVQFKAGRRQKNNESLAPFLPDLITACSNREPKATLSKEGKP